MLDYKTIEILTDEPFQMVRITNSVKDFCKASGITNGLVFVITSHTTTAITVNEGLDCLESDIEDLLRELVADDKPYSHAHWLPTYGRTSANATGHLRAMIVGNHCVFPINDGKLQFGAAQDIYLCEFDGPQARTISLQVIGE
jgi:secondary thiamine-phosphate synthase enzyme